LVAKYECPEKRGKPTSTNNRLRMLKDEVNAYWLFIVVLKLINGCVIAIFVSIRRYGMTYSDITPA
jgi:hypothetical protein